MYPTLIQFIFHPQTVTMAGMVFVMVLAALCVGRGLVSADDGTELKALSSRLLQLLSQESLGK